MQPARWMLSSSAVRNPAAMRLQSAHIVLGGTAGCIVAGRLATADPNLSILVIERGQDNYNVPNITNPALFLSHLLPTSKTAIFYQGNKASQLGDREPIVPSGGTLGGGSSINFMMYTRGQRSDFDAWATPGWSADELFPYLKKVCRVPSILSVGNY